MSALAAPLKSCIRYYDENISYTTLHTTLKRATPTQFMTYKHALLLHKVFIDKNLSHERQKLFFNKPLIIGHWRLITKLAKT